jgi:hypothetical protein
VRGGTPRRLRAISQYQEGKAGTFVLRPIKQNLLKHRGTEEAEDKIARIAGILDETSVRIGG